MTRRDAAAILRGMAMPMLTPYEREAVKVAVASLEAAEAEPERGEAQAHSARQAAAVKMAAGLLYAAERSIPETSDWTAHAKEWHRRRFEEKTDVPARAEPAAPAARLKPDAVTSGALELYPNKPAVGQSDRRERGAKAPNEER